jgi:hypothetical protein
MKNHRENTQETDNWHLSLNKEMESSGSCVKLFEKKELFLSEAKKMFLLNYGCLLFNACS